jgi:hypothetical protein
MLPGLQAPVSTAASQNMVWSPAKSHAVQNRDFSWEFTANTAYDKTKVIEYLTNTRVKELRSEHMFNGEIRHVVGLEMGQIAGYGYARIL